MPETYFTSDLHFRHRRVSEIRGFATVEEHDTHVLEAWNRMITHRNDVWVLGDLTFGKRADSADLFASLNGRKHLVVGNHDPEHVRELPWIEVHDFVGRKFNKQRIYMMHYPMLTWPNGHKGTWHLHGHSHGNLVTAPSTRLDVGPDATGQIALSFGEVADRMADLSYLQVDHHDP